MNKAERDALLTWVAEHRCCAICHWPESDPRRRLEVHHIVGGAGRKHDIRNYLRICERCHAVYHSGRVVGLFPDLNIGILLEVKRECDPDNYDPTYLASLKHKKHLGHEPTPIPGFYTKERERNVGPWKTRTP